MSRESEVKILVCPYTMQAIRYFIIVKIAATVNVRGICQKAPSTLMLINKTVGNDCAASTAVSSIILALCNTLKDSWSAYITRSIAEKIRNICVVWVEIIPFSVMRHKPSLLYNATNQFHCLKP